MSFPRYARYRDSGFSWLGDLPADWDIKPLKYLARFLSGGTPAKDRPQFWDGDIPWASAKDLKADLLTDTVDHITQLALDESATQLVPAGSILVLVRGMMLARAFPVSLATRPIAFNQDLKALITNPGVSPSYLAWTLRGTETETLNRLDEAGHGTKALRMDSWTSMLMPSPPFDEQVAIANFLNSETAKIDALVSEQWRLIELLRAKRTAIIFNAVTKGLDPSVPTRDSEIGWLGRIPAHWELKRLKYLSPSITVGIVVNPSSYVSDEGLPFLYGADVSEGLVTYETARRIEPDVSRTQAKTMLHAGDLVTVRVGDPGVTAVVPPECEGGNCASIMLVRQGQWPSEWLCYAMNSATTRFQVEVVQYGAAQEQFNISHALEFIIPTPPAGEAQQIATLLEEATSRIDQLMTGTALAISLLTERRAALISAAVTGKIDVRDAVRREGEGVAA